MTARRIREWPRVVAAVLVVAVLLVVIGVVAASASSGGSSRGSSRGSSNAGATLAALRDRNSRQSAVLKHDERTLASVQAQLAATSATLSKTQSQLARARARVRCWRQVALHRANETAAKCIAVS